MYSEKDTAQQRIIKEKEKLLSLKEVGDYKALIEWYYYNYVEHAEVNETAQAPHDYQPPNPNLELVLDLLRENIGVLKVLLEDTDPSVRKHVISFLKNMSGHDVLLLLAKRLYHEPRSDLQSTIKDIICISPHIEMIEDFLLIQASWVTGKNFESFAEIVSSIDDRYFLRAILSALRRRCPQGHDACVVNIVPTNSFFVGHKFSKKSTDDLRPHINNAVKKTIPDCIPYYADDETKEDQFCKICRKIQGTRFGIYDITPDCSECNNSNSNVMLELGVSLAFGKTSFVIMEKGSKVPSDLGWVDRAVEYESYSELEALLSKKLEGFAVLGSGNIKR